MTLKDISYSGIVKLALVFIIVPRLVAHLYNMAMQPLIAKIRETTKLASKNSTEATEGNIEQAEAFSTFLTGEINFVLTLLIGTFILTKIIEHLAQNTKLGNLQLGRKTD